jgi:hypothetical protein
MTEPGEAWARRLQRMDDYGYIDDDDRAYIMDDYGDVVETPWGPLFRGSSIIVASWVTRE